MSEISSGTVLITGCTGRLGRSATLAMANRRDGERPDLLLVGRPGQALHDVGGEARAAGGRVHEISCDPASLADVRAAGATVKDLLTSGAVRPLRGLVASAGLLVVDTRNTSADGYELTFAVNYLAHAQLIDGLLDSFTKPARIVLVGSSTYYANWVRHLMMVPATEQRGPGQAGESLIPRRLAGLRSAGHFPRSWRACGSATCTTCPVTSPARRPRVPESLALAQPTMTPLLCSNSRRKAVQPSLRKCS